MRLEGTEFSVRDDGTDSAMPVLYGRFANPGEWTEIRSLVEGHFMERTAPGAFEKTINESKDRMKVLYHHGQDPRVGTQVLGMIRSLSGDTSYEVPLYDTPEIRSLVPGLRDGQYGSSYKFNIVKEAVNENPQRSDWNPKGLPEVTLTELKVIEFGPTPLPAYKGTEARARSVTAEFLLERAQNDPELLALIEGLNRAAALQNRVEAGSQDGDTTSPVSEPPHSSGSPDTGEEEHPSWLLE